LARSFKVPPACALATVRPRLPAHLLTPLQVRFAGAKAAVRRACGVVAPLGHGWTVLMLLRSIAGHPGLLTTAGPRPDPARGQRDVAGRRSCATPIDGRAGLQARSATGTGSHAQAMSDLLGQPAHAIVQSVQSKR
jgi:hypothetical protein